MSTFPLELPDALMEEAKAAAAEDKVSLNHLLASFIEEGVKRRREILQLMKRVSRADSAAALAILDRVPNVAPDEGDELPRALQGRRRR